jgi:CTD kinase subunit gamma
LLAKSHPIAADDNGAGSNSSYYVDYVSRDLGKIVELVVPEGRQGPPNLLSTKQVRFQRSNWLFGISPAQILENWRSKRVIDPQKVDQVISLLATRTMTSTDPVEPPTSSASRLSRNEIFKRIEEVRERHKRLRERRWVQPVSHTPQIQVASFLPFGKQGDGEQEELPIDIEFENEWETTSDWNEDDDEAADEENRLCFASDNSLGERGYPVGSRDAMDVS